MTLLAIELATAYAGIGIALSFFWAGNAHRTAERGRKPNLSLSSWLIMVCIVAVAWPFYLADRAGLIYARN